MGCYDSFDSFVPEAQGVAEANTTIENIHQIYAAGVREVSSDLIIEGTVTAGDEYGNFYKSFIMQSGGYAVEILDGLGYSFLLFPLGSKVVVKLNSLGLDRYLGILRVGLPPASTSLYSLDYMSSESVVDLYVSLKDSGSQLAPQRYTVAELSEERAGELIYIEGLELCTEELVERSWAGYALFRDSDLDSIWCYTSSYADFADLMIPTSTVSLTGILEYGSTDTESNQFQIKMRSIYDCK